MTDVKLLLTLLCNEDHSGCTFVWILLSYVEQLSTIRCQFGPWLLPAMDTRHVNVYLRRAANFDQQPPPATRSA